MLIRTWPLILGLSVAVCGVVVLAGPVRVPMPGMHAQKKKDKPRTEDEEDVPKSTTPDVTRIDDPDVKPAAPKVKVSGDLAQAARETRHPGSKALFASLAVPHDEVVVRGLKGVTVDGAKLPDGKQIVAPFVEHLGDPKEGKGTLELPLIEADGTPLRTVKVGFNRVVSVSYHEQIAVEAVKEFLDQPFDKYDASNKNYLGRLDQLQVGETALAGVLQMHQSARQRGARRGTAWDAVEAELRLGLLEVKLKQLDLLVEAKSWDAAFDFAQQLASTFDRPSEHQKVALVVGTLLEKAIKDEAYTRDRFRAVRLRLRQIEEQFPSNSKLVEPINDRLRKLAEALRDRAIELEKDKKPAEAADLLKQAEDTWPDLAGLRDHRLRVMGAYQILRVGMREFPLYLSPGWAHTDSEKRASELLFESLVGLTPDGQGSVYYRPILARSRPLVIPLGRQFELPRDARWSDGHPLTAGDLSFTLDQITKGGGSERGPVWSEFFNLEKRAQSGVDPFRAKIVLRQGMIDPLSAMSFKVLPKRAKPHPDSEEFAKRPVGSGPFAFAPKASDADKFVKFKANPHYGARAGRSGLPYIRELRIYAPDDPVKELKEDRLDMATDLSAEQAAALAADPNIEVKMPNARTPNRRVYFLAINHRKPTLVNADLRIALARAISREKLLDDHFRKGLGKKVHRAVNGPYPAGSWACSPLLAGKGDDKSLDPFDADLARTKLRAALSKLAQREVTLTLKYPQGDPVLANAISALCGQVEKELGPHVKLSSLALPPHQLREAVEQTHDYELAYYSYDFPDESYWLKPLLGGDNYLGYTGPLQGKIESASTLRHFSQVKEYAHAIHRQLLEGEMPLIPLWQLDPLIAVRKNRIKGMHAIDPQALFTRVEEWSVGAGR